MFWLSTSEDDRKPTSPVKISTSSSTSPRNMVRRYGRRAVLDAPGAWHCRTTLDFPRSKQVYNKGRGPEGPRPHEWSGGATLPVAGSFYVTKDR